MTGKNIREAERIKLENEQEEKRIIAEKLKIAKKECFKAYKTLKKIEALLESGVTWQNYSLTVNGAKFELNMISATREKILGFGCLASFAEPYASKPDIYYCSGKLRQVLWIEASKRK